jgi:hypothetical protein
MKFNVVSSVTRVMFQSITDHAIVSGQGLPPAEDPHGTNAVFSSEPCYQYRRGAPLPVSSPKVTVSQL